MLQVWNLIAMELKVDEECAPSLAKIMWILVDRGLFRLHDLSCFVMYDFVMHDFSVYTGITNRVISFSPAFIHEKWKWRKIILLFRYVS